jgi:hypothetical protein
MAKTNLKVGKCECCGATLIVDIDDEFYCNSYGCVVMNQIKGDEDCYNIIGLDKVVHGIYHPDLELEKKGKKC